MFNCNVSDSLSDHYAFHWFTNAKRPVRPRKTVSLRNLKAIDMDQFASDLLFLPLLTEEMDDISCLLDWYNDGLTDVLNKHAPLQKRVFTIRPDNPWNNQDISSARKRVRRLERRWKSTGLTVDKEILHHALSELRSLISSAKISQLRNHRENRKGVFIQDRCLVSSEKKPPLRLHFISL